MKVRILSGRNNPNRNASWQIVYEWEDIISTVAKIPLVTESAITRRFHSYLHKLGADYLANRLFVKNYSLVFTSISTPDKNPLWNNHTIPVIIDFWLKDEEIPIFCKRIKSVPLLLVTSKEVYNKIKPYCTIGVEHWPLSYPDQYALKDGVNFNKIYDFSFIGRPNPFFIRLLDRYCESHPSFSYIMNYGEKGNRHYRNNKGEFIANDEGRQSYLDMIRKTKISCYTTPGYDEAKKGANGYNQVTPRVFEMLCNGCHIIGHYPLSDDVKWYNLPTIVPNINNYEEFEKTLDSLLIKEIDYSKIKDFMENHYTSKRAERLLVILNDYKLL